MTGVFLYRSQLTDRVERIHVRDCPDPAAARLMLEEQVVGSAVVWQETR